MNIFLFINISSWPSFLSSFFGFKKNFTIINYLDIEHLFLMIFGVINYLFLIIYNILLIFKNFDKNNNLLSSNKIKINEDKLFLLFIGLSFITCSIILPFILSFYNNAIEMDFLLFSSSENINIYNIWNFSKNKNYLIFKYIITFVDFFIIIFSYLILTNLIFTLSNDFFKKMFDNNNNNIDVHLDDGDDGGDDKNNNDNISNINNNNNVSNNNDDDFLKNIDDYNLINNDGENIVKDVDDDNIKKDIDDDNITKDVYDGDIIKNIDDDNIIKDIDNNDDDNNDNQYLVSEYENSNDNEKLTNTIFNIDEEINFYQNNESKKINLSSTPSSSSNYFFNNKEKFNDDDDYNNNNNKSKNINYLQMTKIIEHEEYQYIKLIEELIYFGNDKNDRTGVGTFSLFGKSMKFSLKNNNIPILTTKKIFWRGIVEELLWFISGNTNVKTLQDKNIHFWDGNSSREYLDSIGLNNRDIGDVGPIYGFQWRYFGANYNTCNDNYENNGFDQLLDLIYKIKNNPNDRRMIITSWNPNQLKDMALPPCHILSQFYVYNGYLSCQMYQRSADMGLGVPFNIASYSLFTYLIAQCTDLLPGDFTYIIGDCHVYKNHIPFLKEQIKKKPFDFPQIKINTKNKDITKFKYEDFELINYKSHEAIKMEMAV